MTKIRLSVKFETYKELIAETTPNETPTDQNPPTDSSQNPTESNEKLELETLTFEGVEFNFYPKIN